MAEHEIELLRMDTGHEQGVHVVFRASDEGARALVVRMDDDEGDVACLAFTPEQCEELANALLIGANLMRSVKPSDPGVQ